MDQVIQLGTWLKVVLSQEKNSAQKTFAFPYLFQAGHWSTQLLRPQKALTSLKYFFSMDETLARHWRCHPSQQKLVSPSHRRLALVASNLQQPAGAARQHLQPRGHRRLRVPERAVSLRRDSRFQHHLLQRVPVLQQRHLVSLPSQLESAQVEQCLHLQPEQPGQRKNCRLWRLAGEHGRNQQHRSLDAGRLDNKHGHPAEADVQPLLGLAQPLRPSAHRRGQQFSLDVRLQRHRRCCLSRAGYEPRTFQRHLLSNAGQHKLEDQGCGGSRRDLGQGRNLGC